MVTSMMARDGRNVSLLPSRSWPVELVKLVRDYPVMLTVIAVTIAVRPAGLMWIMIFFTVVNLGFLAASIALAAWTSWHGQPDTAAVEGAARSPASPRP